MCLFGQLLEARLPDLIPYRKGKLWGFCDSTKKIIIAPQWERVSLFGANSAVVQKDGRAGLIDRTGKIILEPVYKTIDYQEQFGVRKICLFDRGTVGAVNSLGEIIISPTYNWLCWQGPYLEGMRNCKIGVFDTTGHEVMPFIYASCGDYPVSMGDSGQFAMPKNGKWGVVDTAGNTIIPFEFYWVTASGCGSWEVRTNYFESKYYDTQGKYISDSSYCPAQPPWLGFHQLVNGMKSYELESGLCGYLNAKGDTIFTPQFVIVNDFNADGLAFVEFRTKKCDSCFGKGYVDIHQTKYWEE